MGCSPFHTCFKLIFILGLGLSSCMIWAKTEFPTGCLSETQNFQQACKALKEIGSTDTLVFATGETMKGCFLKTKGPEEINLLKEKQIAQRKLFDLLEKKFPTTSRIGISLLLRKPETLLTDPAYKTTLQKADTDIIRNLIRMQKQADAFESEETKTIPIKFGTELKIAREELLYLVEKNVDNPKDRANIAKKLRAIEPGPMSTQKLSCRPQPNAFYRTDDMFGIQDILGLERSAMIVAQGSVTQYPYHQRLLVWGHEMAHSFDPCFLGTQTEKTHPFAKLLSCLQNDVGNFKNVTTSKDMCQQKHLRESFCDEVGTHMVAEYLKRNPPLYFNKPQDSEKPGLVYLPRGYESVILYLDLACASPENFIDPTHPSDRARLELVLLRNPTLAKALNCPLNKPYCDLKQGLINPPNASTKPALPSNQK